MQRLDVFRHRDFDQAAIDAITNAQIRAQRLDMDVGRALVERLADDLIDEFDDARLLIVVLVDDICLVLAGIEVVVIEIAAFENLFKGVGTHTVKPTKRFVQALA